jgi:hypothetical protein
MSPETEAALLWSIPRLRPAELDRLRELLYTRLDWTRVLGILATHRTMGVAWHNVLRHLIGERGALVPTYLFKGLEVAYKGQAAIAREQIVSTLELLDALSAEGIPAVVLKGAGVARMAYPDLGMRVFNDNDVLVEHGRIADAGAVLHRLGYVQGSWDYDAGTVRPARRADILKYPVSSHQTHPYQRPVDGPALECHRVDLHFSVDLTTSNRTDAVVGDLLRRRVTVGEPPLWTVDPTDMFVFCCVHFAREATHYGEVARLKDLVLYKLVDLLALLDGAVEPAGIAGRSVEFGATDQAYHALFHLDALFPGRVPPDLLATLRPDAADRVHEVVDGDRRVYRWEAPIVERFFDNRRFTRLGNGSPLPDRGAVRRRARHGSRPRTVPRRHGAGG